MGRLEEVDNDDIRNILGATERLTLSFDYRLQPAQNSGTIACFSRTAKEETDCRHGVSSQRKSY